LQHIQTTRTHIHTEKAYDDLTNLLIQLLAKESS